MAITLMGGLLVATVLTLLFLPALYAFWFGVRREQAFAKPQQKPLGPAAEHGQLPGLLVPGE
jgi:hypothetical protein